MGVCNNKCTRLMKNSTKYWWKEYNTGDPNRKPIVKYKKKAKIWKIILTINAIYNPHAKVLKTILEYQIQVMFCGQVS